MYSNIGKKIKTLAVAFCALGMAASLISGLAMFFAGTQYSELGAMAGLITIIVGCLTSWIASFAIYGFGELIDTTMDNNRQLKKIEKSLRQLQGKEY